MQCPETLLGPEAYFAALALAVGVLVNAIKRIPKVPADVLPVAAFALGYVIDGALGHYSCGLTFGQAALSGLGGGLAGLAAAGGHEALMRSASRVGLGKLATVLLGKAKQVKAKTLAASLVLIFAFVCAPVVVSCDGALGKAAKVAHTVGNALEILDGLASKSQTYFDRHPSLDNSAAVFDLIKLVREAVDNGEHEKAVELYRDLRKQLDDLGIPSASPPGGGAETDTPEPEPFEVPTVEEFKAAL